MEEILIDGGSILGGFGARLFQTGGLSVEIGTHDGRIDFF